MDQLTAALFAALDTDENTVAHAHAPPRSALTLARALELTLHNGLVDALEFLGTVATGQISVDELTLALKSTLTGLCKLSTGVVCPSELVLEEIALHAFHKAQKNGSDDCITLHEFLRFAETTPEMTSWIDYFDSPEEHVEENDQDDSDLELELPVAPLDDTDTARKRDLSFPCDVKAPSFAQSTPIPLKPWQSVVANAAPSAPPSTNPRLPAACLDLEWIHGFNSDFRGVVKYITAAKIVYPAGSVVVLYDVIEHKQQFAFHHSGKVQTLAVHPSNKTIVASGERGLVPKVVIWSALTLESTLSVLRGFHKNGIRHLAWAPNGRMLITIGQDDFNCVAVYQWEQSTAGVIEWTKPAAMIFADRCGSEPVHACIAPSNNLFVTCGQRHLFFWARESDDRYTSEHPLFFKRRGVLGRKTKVQTLLSLATLPNDPNFVLAGTARGQILLFEGRNCMKVLHAHASAVNVLHSFAGGMLSAGRDGKIRLWSKRMEPGAQFDMEALGSVSSRVRSVSASPDGGAKFLVATAGAEIFEIATSDGSNLHFGAMLCGHFAHELHGLAVNPLKKEFCTTGDDRTIRIWDMSSHRQIRMTMLEAPSQTCAYSPDGSLLAIGQGADDSKLSKRNAKLLNPNKQGAFAILSESALAVKYETKDSKKYIRNVKFSGDGLTLAVGSSDNFIYAYNTEDWASKGKCKARDASAVLSHFDFSATGGYIMASATNKGEMVFFESASGVEITRIATLKDVEWLSWTCPYGWWVQGAWPTSESFRFEVTALDRSSNSESRHSSQLLVTGDNFGVLRLYRYPCIAENALCQIIQGPSSAISAIHFSADNNAVIACATEERCIFQWRVEYEEEDLNSDNAVVAEYEYHPTSDDELEMSHGSERSAFDEAVAAGDFALDLLYQCNSTETCDDKDAAARPGGVASTALPVKPWVSSSIAPAGAPDEADLELSAVPSENLELDWVYGYRCHDARNNVFLTKSKGYLVFPAANVVVVQDKKLWLQRHFKQHTDEVTSIAVHFGFKGKKRPNTSSSGGRTDTPSGSTSTGRGETELPTTAFNSSEIVASGQMGKYPTIHVWRIDTLQLTSPSSSPTVVTCLRHQGNQWLFGQPEQHGPADGRSERDLVLAPLGQFPDQKERDPRQEGAHAKLSKCRLLRCAHQTAPKLRPWRITFGKSYTDSARLSSARSTTQSTSTTCQAPTPSAPCSTSTRASSRTLTSRATRNTFAATAITACSASHPGTSPDVDKAVVVAGTSHGALNMFKFPCFMKGAGFKTYTGHSGEEEIKPYLSAIIPPSSDTKEPTAEDGSAGKLAFSLEHVFGFRAYDVRNNVVYSKTKHVVYHAGCIGIHYDRRTHKQKFYREHRRPIVSLAGSKDGTFVATGEICGENLQRESPRIHIWEPTSCATVAVLSEFHAKAVSYISFSANSRMLASIGQDEHHSLAVYASTSGLWFDGALLASSKTTRHDVFFVTFIEDSASPFQLVSGGKNHVVFWKIDPPSLVGTYGVFGIKAQLQPILCGATISSLVVTGCSTGHLYVWESCAVSRAIPAHNGAVYAIHATKEGCVSGGRDGHVKIWSKTVTPLADFDVNDVKPASQNALVRSVCWDIAEDRVLIGTKGGEIIELSRLTGETSLVTESHFDHTGLYGLSVHPQKAELVATVGEDQTLVYPEMRTALATDAASLPAML
ncbi:hypothetical protein PybrP1_003217 [[Pythium] brassicae (nom. inval.)]|nr:hypothetical protein PybrP1_003217 [[Pythium] brassicae (nom. inval.)]